MIKRFFLRLTLLGAALTLCACAQSGVPVTDNAPTLTLPPANVQHVAPIGDAALEYSANATLYLPRHDGSRLSAVTAEVAFSYARPEAESLARALCNHPGDGVARSLGGDVRLSLYGANPVEVSRNVATVNLSATALQLDRQSLYLAGQAIANTLCELPQIDYVNLLVMDKPVGLDIAGALPMGTFSRSAGQDVSAAYEQLLTRRPTADESAADKALSANVTLYFPIAGTSGLMSEARACAFESLAFPDMVTALMRELAAGSEQGVDTPALSLMADLLTAPPALSEADGTGGRVVSLAFEYNYDDMLEAHGLTRAQGLASVCYTLCTNLPGVSGVSVTIGEAPVTTLMLTDSFESSVDFAGNVLKRSDFSSLLYDAATLYLRDGNRLARTQRAVPFHQQSSPRRLLTELARGPQPGDGTEGLQAVMAEGAITDADILGLAVADGTMLVNLAPSFEKAVEGQNERLLAYAMVNTLCRNERVKDVCFFVNGSQRASFGGELYWLGTFAPME